MHALVPAPVSGAAAHDGHQAVAALFGDTDQVVSALANGGAGNSDLLKQLLPVVLPIVLAYIGKQLSGGSAPQTTHAQSGGLGEILGGVLSGQGGARGDILGGVLGGKK